MTQKLVINDTDNGLLSFGAKSFPEPMNDSQLVPEEQISLNTFMMIVLIKECKKFYPEGVFIHIQCTNAPTF